MGRKKQSLELCLLEPSLVYYIRMGRSEHRGGGQGKSSGSWVLNMALEF